MEIKKLPSSWADIKLSQYAKLQPVLKLDNPIERVIYTLAVLLDKPTQEIEQMQLTNVQEVLKRFNFMRSLPDKLLSDTTTVAGQQFRFIFKAKDLTAGQYISVTTKLKQASDDEDWIYQNIHEILASISVPIGEKIDNDYYQRTAQLFYENMSVADALPVCFFFSKLSRNLTDIIADYSRRAKEKAQSEEKAMERVLRKNGGGL